MRSRSSANFTLDDLRHIASLCSRAGVKTYLTVNTIIYDDDIALLHDIIDAAAQAGISAIIAADPAAIFYARSRGVEVHISTQANISNVEAVEMYAQWADVVVLARELSLDRVGAIHGEICRRPIVGPGGKPVRIEMFCHGGQPRGLHADMPPVIHRHRPRDGRSARYRKPVYHVAQGSLHDRFHRPSG